MENVQSSLALASQLVESGQVKVTALLQPSNGAPKHTHMHTKSIMLTLLILYRKRIWRIYRWLSRHSKACMMCGLFILVSISTCFAKTTISHKGCCIVFRQPLYPGQRTILHPCRLYIHVYPISTPSLKSMQRFPWQHLDPPQQQLL